MEPEENEGYDEVVIDRMKERADEGNGELEAHLKGE